MFRGVKLIFWFDLIVMAIGALLVIANWQILTGSNVEATVIRAEPTCTYSVYFGKLRRRSVVSGPRSISGKCVSTEGEAKELIKIGYNQVYKGWRVVATIEKDTQLVEFYMHNVAYLATKQSWELFLEEKKSLDRGSKISLLRSITGVSVQVLNQDLGRDHRRVALFKTIIGLILLFGTLSIHGVPFWFQQLKPRD